jgi:hypothetical protein
MTEYFLKDRTTTKHPVTKHYMNELYYATRSKESYLKKNWIQIRLYFGTRLSSQHENGGGNEGIRFFVGHKGSS